LSNFLLFPFMRLKVRFWLCFFISYTPIRVYAKSGEDQNFKTTLKQLRKKVGITQAQLADAIGTSQAAVAAYETGTKAPELAKLPAIAKALGVSVADLFKEEPGGSQAAKVRMSPNRRAIKLQKAFEKLKPVEQQLVLKQVEGLAGQK
jgi:transcriptional regulator with XRE-family HTH domain